MRTTDAHMKRVTFFIAKLVPDAGRGVRDRQFYAAAYAVCGVEYMFAQ